MPSACRQQQTRFRARGAPPEPPPVARNVPARSHIRLHHLLRRLLTPALYPSLRKQQERRAKLATLPAVYCAPSSDSDAKILALSLSQIVDACEDGSLAPTHVLQAYGKRCVAAHEATNCLADVFFEEAERGAAAPSSSARRPLHGVPVSVKDCIDVAGHDSTLGYSSRVGQPAVQSAPIVRLLRDAGGLVYAKTTLPTGPCPLSVRRVDVVALLSSVALQVVSLSRLARTSLVRPRTPTTPHSPRARRRAAAARSSPLRAA